MVMVRSLEPQEIADVSVQMCSPSTAGMYQGQWRMCTATGLYYGGEWGPFLALLCDIPIIKGAAVPLQMLP